MYHNHPLPEFNFVRRRELQGREKREKRSRIGAASVTRRAVHQPDLRPPADLGQPDGVAGLLESIVGKDQGETHPLHQLSVLPYLEVSEEVSRGHRRACQSDATPPGEASCEVSSETDLGD